jgi:shikimate 5-dehydrogenase
LGFCAAKRVLFIHNARTQAKALRLAQEFQCHYLERLNLQSIQTVLPGLSAEHIAVIVNCLPPDVAVHENLLFTCDQTIFVDVSYRNNSHPGSFVQKPVVLKAAEKSRLITGLDLLLYQAFAQSQLWLRRCPSNAQIFVAAAVRSAFASEAATAVFPGFAGREQVDEVKSKI